MRSRRRRGFEAIARELHLSIPDQLVELRGTDSYDEILDPLDVAGCVWGGQMLPDSLPILGNGAGDHILARFGPDGSVREIVEWEHEGCSWHPADLGTPSRGVATSRREAQAALDSGLSRRCMEVGGSSVSEALGVEWNTLYSWLVDTTRIDPAVRSRLCELTSMGESDLLAQDWDRAESLAVRTLAERPDLAWPGNVLGWAARRRGDRESAVRGFKAALRGLRTTEGFTGAWALPGECVAISALQELAPALLDDEPDLRACAAGTKAVRARWLAAGTEARTGAEAYDAYFRAGWDWFFTNDMDVVLDHLARAADTMESRALGALARLHLKSL